ncbi:MAG TPA: pantoate--beta-alanine ligase [Candidatus Dormibacteraeota bacterium]
MITIETPAAMRARVREWGASSIGLVPTMGALHAGHRSLIERARSENDRVVVSIFVNPLQFGPNEDLARYPRPIEKDLEMLRELNVNAVYMPSVADMYPEGATTRVVVGGVAETLEGAARPGHFEGVATVVAKLFSAVRPDRAYFGRKDAQQVAVVKRMAADLDTGVEIIACPIVRDADGLAVSSRNVYLTADERKAALSLSRALSAGATGYAGGDRDLAAIQERIRAVLAAEPLAQIDYAELVDPATFRPSGTLAVLAVTIGKTRLIDNHDVSKPFPG